MRPVVTVEEMRRADAAAPVSYDVIVSRAGAAVAARATLMMGGAYGRHVVVVAGPGSNGADGRDAAGRLRRRGARVTVVDALHAPQALPSSDLVIDAAFGTGFRGEHEAPEPGVAPVLAVDIPSGVAGDTGEPCGRPVRAACTVTMAALKPGLLLGSGPAHAGEVVVADIGLAVDASLHLVDDGDVADWWPARSREAHKWQSAVGVVAGSPGMVGAARLAGFGALRAGAGLVRLALPGATAAEVPPSELMSVALPAEDWTAGALSACERARCVVVGPGLGRHAATVSGVRRFLEGLDVPAVVDADGLHALGRDLAAVVRGRRAPTILTPHDGEFERLTGAAPKADRLASARDLAETSGAIIVLKGPTTIVAGADAIFLASGGDARLATAGTGDVLSGMVAAFVARVGPGAAVTDLTLAAALAAHTHQRAALLGQARGFAAGDLLDLVPRYLSGLDGGTSP